MILTIASPDKVTISMFIDFYKNLYDSSVKTFDFNCLFSEDVIKSKMEAIIEQEKKLLRRDQEFIIIYYKMKSKTKNISQMLIESSDFVIGFDMFSSHPEIIKEKYPDIIKPILDRWSMNIKKLNNEK